MSDSSLDEKTRKCPACRSTISILAATCKFCGRNVPPPMTDIRRLTASELEGSPANAAADPVKELGSFARDLTVAASKGQMTRQRTREREVSDIIEFLVKKKEAALLLLGGEGAGKTSLVESVALELATGKSPKTPESPRIVQIEVGAVRGSNPGIIDRLGTLSRVSARMPEVVVFIDDILPLLQTVHVQGSPQQILCSMFENHDRRCIAAITPEQYAAARDISTALLDAFELYRVEPLDPKATLEILQEQRPLFEKQYEVRIGTKALAAAVDLTREFMPKQCFPGKAIEVMKHACNRYKRKCVMRETYPKEWQDEVSMKQLGDKVDVHDVKRTVAEITSIDIDKAEAQLWKQKLAERLSRHVFGQDAALKDIADAVAQVKVRFRTPGRPAGVFLFGGPCGVGKVHTAKVLAQKLLGSQEDLAVLDMAEYAGPDGMRKLFGFVPGGGGNIEEGILACVVRDTPLAIVVLEDINKAHKHVVEALVPLLATGVVRDASGQALSLTRCLVIMTVDGLPASGPLTKDALIASLLPVLPRDLLERLDLIVPFETLDSDNARRIVQRALEDFYEELRPLAIRMRVTDAAYRLVLSEGYDRNQGVAGIPALLEQAVFQPIRKGMATGTIAKGCGIEIAEEQGKVVVKTAETPA